MTFPESVLDVFPPPTCPYFVQQGEIGPIGDDKSSWAEESSVNRTDFSLPGVVPAWELFGRGVVVDNNAVVFLQLEKLVSMTALRNPC